MVIILRSVFEDLLFGDIVLPVVLEDGGDGRRPAGIVVLLHDDVPPLQLPPARHVILERVLGIAERRPRHLRRPGGRDHGRYDGAQQTGDATASGDSRHGSIPPESVDGGRVRKYR